MQREPLLVPCAPALLAAGTLVLGVANADNYDTYEQRTASQAAARQSAEGADDMQDAKEQVREATEVVQQMRRDPKLTALLQRAVSVGAQAGGAGGSFAMLLMNDRAVDVRDEDENRAYFERKTSVEQVLSRAVKKPDAQMLRDALPDRKTRSSDR